MCTNTHTGTSLRIQDALTGEGKESVEVCQKAFSQNPNKMELRPSLSPLASQRGLSWPRQQAAGMRQQEALTQLGVEKHPTATSPSFFQCS